MGTVVIEPIASWTGTELGDSNALSKSWTSLYFSYTHKPMSSIIVCSSLKPSTLTFWSIKLQNIWGTFVFLKCNNLHCNIYEKTYIQYDAIFNCACSSMCSNLRTQGLTDGHTLSSTQHDKTLQSLTKFDRTWHNLT